MNKPGNSVRRLLSHMLALGALIGALTLVPTRPSSAQEVTGSWSYTGSLNTPRGGFTATLLPNGKVLVAGGYSQDMNGNPVDLSSTELYDPATGTWSYSGSLGQARGDHTATLLPNGKVLVVGGESAVYGAYIFSPTELYDPATGTWSPTGDPNSNLRFVHTATLLPNGKVLVIWGNTLYPNYNAVELYDPGTGTWSFTRNLNAPRQFHTATLLHNGKVMVTGGLVNGAFNTEIYDPVYEYWSNVQGGPSVWYPSVTPLPNGKVLVMGAGAELFDPATGTWTATASPHNRVSGGTLLNNGKVLATGFASAELYDPATGTWNITASPHTGGTTILLNNGKVLLVGSQSAELYTATGSGTAPTPMPTPTPGILQATPNPIQVCDG